MEDHSEQSRDQFVGTRELMDTLSVSRSTVNRLVKRGLPHIWVGSVRRFSKDQVLLWLKKNNGQ